MRERQRDYELMFIISPLRSGEEEITATINRVQQAITSAGGEIARIDQSAPWGRRKLAYPVRRYTEGEASRRPFTEGYYVLCTFSLTTTGVTELERSLKLNDAILRYLLTTVEQSQAPVGVADTSRGTTDADAEDEDAAEGDEG